MRREKHTGNLCVLAEACRDNHSLCSAETPADYVRVFTSHDLVETRYLWCHTAHSKALRLKLFYCCFLNYLSSSCTLASCVLGDSLILCKNVFFIVVDTHVKIDFNTSLLKQLQGC